MKKKTSAISFFTVPAGDVEEVFGLIDNYVRESSAGGGNVARLHLWRKFVSLFPAIEQNPSQWAWEIRDYRTIIMQRTSGV